MCPGGAAAQVPSVLATRAEYSLLIAQAMNFGTFDDIVVLEQMVGKKRLVEVMLQAEPGWFSDRSWELWRGRLSFAAGGAIPEQAPRRSFHAAAP